MRCRFRGKDGLAHYSPWSCGTISHCFSSFEPETHTHASAHTCSEHSVRSPEVNPVNGCVCARFLYLESPCFCLTQELDGNVGGGGSSGGGRRWLNSLDHYRRLKDEDPIIPFSEAPIISKWGAISRLSRTGYHTTDPVQATACQGRASTTPINFKGKSMVTGVIKGQEKCLFFCK